MEMRSNIGDTPVMPVIQNQVPGMSHLKYTFLKVLWFPLTGAKNNEIKIFFLAKSDGKKKKWVETLLCWSKAKAKAKHKHIF